MSITSKRAVSILRVTHKTQPVSSRWLSLLVLCAGFLMIVVDATIVNVALPSIQRDLGFSQSSLAWVVNAYLIAYAGFMLLAGRLGDLIGRKRIFIIGLALFTAASVLCGLSFSQPLLIAARFVQGIGGALSSAVILGMLVTLFPEPDEQARAIGIFSFVASAGASVGLLSGGVITQVMSWHWIFFVNLPIGVATALLGARILDGDPGIGLRAGADALGAVLVTAALMLGVYTIVTSSDYGLGSPRTLGLGAVTLGLLAAFIVRQAVARTPILPLRLFRSRTLSGSNIVQAVMSGAFFGFFFIGSLDFERVLRYGPMAIGLAFLPLAVAMGALSIWLSARLIVRFGARRVLLAGQAVIVVGMALFALGPMRGNYALNLLPLVILLGVGGGLSFPALTVLAMSDVTPEDAGLASGLLNTTGQVGAALGLAVLATVATSQAGQLLAGGQSVAAALSGGFHIAWALGAGLVIVTLVVAATMLRSTRAIEPAATVADSMMADTAGELEPEEVCA